MGSSGGRRLRPAKAKVSCCCRIRLSKPSKYCCAAAPSRPRSSPGRLRSRCLAEQRQDSGRGLLAFPPGRAGDGRGLPAPIPSERCRPCPSKNPLAYRQLAKGSSASRYCCWRSRTFPLRFAHDTGQKLPPAERRRQGRRRAPSRPPSGQGRRRDRRSRGCFLKCAEGKRPTSFFSWLMTTFSPSNDR